MQWYVGRKQGPYKRFVLANLAPRFPKVTQSACYLVSFEDTSRGQVAMVIYEWRDVAYLGKASSRIDDTIPVSNMLYFSIGSTFDSIRMGRGHTSARLPR